MSSGRYKPRVPFVTSLLRYNISAATATATDYSVLALCTEIIGFDPVLSTFIGAIAGGTVAFLLGRNWTFLNKEGNISAQGLKFLVVVGGSILLNTFGMYIATKYLSLGHYMIARILVSVTIGVCYNFPMQRYFVFR